MWQLKLLKLFNRPGAGFLLSFFQRAPEEPFLLGGGAACLP